MGKLWRTADSAIFAIELLSNLFSRGIDRFGCQVIGSRCWIEAGEYVGKLLALGCYEISLGDTIGVGTPAKASEMLQAVAGEVPMDQLGLHFHDTYGQALANILACLELGVATIDCAVAGLGGCPYAPGASGNVATEDVLYMLDGLGIETGVDFEPWSLPGNLSAISWAVRRLRRQRRHISRKLLKFA